MTWEDILKENFTKKMNFDYSDIEEFDYYKEVHNFDLRKLTSKIKMAIDSLNDKITADSYVEFTDEQRGAISELEIHLDNALDEIEELLRLVPKN